MKALLRPALVLGLSIAIATTSLVGSSSVALAAVTPSITQWPLALVVYEGDTPTIHVTFTDPDPGEVHTADIDWGDGTPWDSLSLPAGTFTFDVTKAVPYANDQPTALRMQITVSDPTRSNSKFPGVTVLNAAPSFTSFGLSATEMEAGQEITATGTFTDGGANDTHTVTLNWGDGTPTTTTAAVGSFTSDPHTYTGVGDFTVTATVRDDAGATAVATSTVSVRAPNQAPSIVSFGVTAGSEGGTSTLALTFADVDAADTHTISVSWGDSSPSDPAVELAAGVTTFDATHVYADTGNYSVVLTLSDSAGHTVTASTSVSPTNVGPVVGSLELSPSSVVDGQLLTVSGTFTDPGTADTFTLTVDWGDGTSSTQLLDTARSFSATHAYDAAGPVTIKATVEDRDHATSSSSADLVVLSSNHAPAGLALEATVTGSSVVVNGSFADADALDTHTVVLTWGDDATTRQTLDAVATTFNASHVYAASDTYTVTATVTDPAGASTNAVTQVVVTVPAESAAAILDQMSSLVWSFDLDRNTQRWLLKKIGDLKGSLTYGNSHVCSSTGTLSHIMAFAQRTLESEQYAALSALGPQLEAAAGCTSTASQHPKVQRAATVTTTVTPALTTTVTPALTQKKDTTTKTTTTKTTTTKTTGGRSPH